MSGGAASEEARAFCAAHEKRLLNKPMTPEALAEALVDASSQPLTLSEPCPNIVRCPMFPKFQSDHMLSLYKQIYCEPPDGTYKQCARYRTMKSGRRPSELLLPHGQELPPLP